MRAPVEMDHVGKEDVTITLLCVVNITMRTRKSIPSFVAAQNGQIESIHNLPDNTCLSLCRFEKIQNPPVRKYSKV